MRLDYLLDLPELGTRQSMILDQFGPRFQPEFRFPVPAVHMNVHSRFFPGKEEKSVALFPEYRWTQSADPLAR
jgi:hypothetical protein